MIIIMAVVIICLSASFYVVDVRHQAVITQFGKPVRTVTEPGLCVKTPFIQEVRYFDKRLLEWSGEPSDILTRDKENIGVGTWARWKIAESLKFYTSLGTEDRGMRVLDEVIESAVKKRGQCVYVKGSSQEYQPEARIYDKRTGRGRGY